MFRDSKEHFIEKFPRITNIFTSDKLPVLVSTIKVLLAPL